jgi:hypothetical protein
MEITSYTELLGDMAKNSSTQSYTPQLDKCNLVQEVNHIKLLLQKKNEIYISHRTKYKIN